MHPYTQRPLQSRSHALTLNLMSGLQYELLVRVQTRGAMILPISFCMSWQDGFHQPIRGEQISRDYVRTRPTRDGWGTMQIHIEGKGWVP